MTRWTTWIRTLLGRAHLEREMGTELETHIESYIDDLVKSGLSRSEAERRARMEFGTVEAVKEECREALGLNLVDEIKRNIRYAFRMLRKNPTFTAAAVTTLAVCIGANTAIFSVVDAVLLRPLPYPEPERLVQLVTTLERQGVTSEQFNHTGHVWQAVRDHATQLDATVFLGIPTGANLVAESNVEYVQQHRVSTGFFRVLGVEPMMGRGFTPEEDQPGGPAVTVLSYALWKSAFHGDTSVLGRDVLLRGEPHTIVGVMPLGFRTSVSADLWTPLRPTTTGEGSGQNYSVVARLHPGTTWVQAESEVRSLEEEAFAELRVPSDLSVRLGWVPLQDALIEFSRKPLLIVWAAGGLVLFIGCVNIASLLLARGAERTHELATRVALGGGRSTLMRQLLSESLVLAACGGVVGVALGYLGVQELQAFLRGGFDIFQEGEGFHVWQEIFMGGRVLAIMLGVTLLTSVLFGLYPAWHAARVDIRQALVEGGSRGLASRRSRWPRRFLVIGEVALGTVLLVGAGLLVRTFSNLSRLNPGFDPENVMTASISLDDARYATSASVNRLFEQSLDRIRQVPGIEYAAISLRLPYERGLNVGFRVADGTGADRSDTLTNLSYVTEDYFQTLGIPVTRGRSFDFRDRQGEKRSLVVNEAFVEKYLPERDPIGARIAVDGETREIVGVVASVIQKSSGWGSYGPVDRIPSAYISAHQVSDGFFKLVHTWFAPTWVARTSRPEATVIDAVQRSVASVDAYLPFAGFNTMRGLMSRSLSQQRIQATLLGILAGIALLLALVGIYGLVARTVVERTREMGIRMALGATLSQSVRSAALPGMMLSLVGVVFGSFIAVLAARTLRSLIWGIGTSDPTTLISVAIGLFLVATSASLLPALRITWLNPARTLREQ